MSSLADKFDSCPYNVNGVSKEFEYSPAFGHDDRHLGATVSQTTYFKGYS